MKNLKSIAYLCVLLGLGCVVSRALQSETADGQFGAIVQRVDQNANKFRISLDRSLVNGIVDDRLPENDIYAFEPDFERAVNQFKEQFRDHRSSVETGIGVKNILQKALLIDRFMNRNILNSQAQGDWAVVRTDLSALASAYKIDWQWDRKQTSIVSNRTSRVQNDEIGKLVLRIDTDCGALRSSLAEALASNHLNHTTEDVKLTEAVAGLKRATEQIRNRFSAKLPITKEIRETRAKVDQIDKQIIASQFTPAIQYDWSKLRVDLSELAGLYKL